VQQTSSNELLQTLTEAGVIQEDGDTVELSEEFRDRMAEGADIDSYRGASIESINGIDEADEQYRQRLRRVIATLQTFELTVRERELVAAAISLTELTRDSSGKDNWLVTTSGQEFSDLVASGENVLALIFKNECDPCDRVRTKLETLHEESKLPPELIVVAVPGPDHRHLLHDEFDVIGAPTLLFCQNGRVEMRLTGDVHREQIRSDVKRIYG